MDPMHEQRISVARTQLEAGVPTAAIATTLQARFGISRATAYRDVGAASAELQKSDDGPSQDECDAGPADPDDVLGILNYHLQIAHANGDTKALCAVVASIDRVKRWRGTGQPNSVWA